jgi:hypothetical protein
MTTDPTTTGLTAAAVLWPALGGLLGAAVRCLAQAWSATPGPQLAFRSGETVKHLFAGTALAALLPTGLGFYAALAPAFGLPAIPAETLARVAAALANPWASLPACAALVYLGIDLDWLMRRRKTPGDPAGGQGGRATLGLLVVLAAVLALGAGCQGVGLGGSPTLVLDRGQVEVTLLRLARFYGRAEVWISLACRASALSADACKELAAGRDQLDQALLLIEARLTSPDPSLDPAQLQRALDMALALAGRLGFAGLKVEGLPAPPRLALAGAGGP